MARHMDSANDTEDCNDREKSEFDDKVKEVDGKMSASEIINSLKERVNNNNDINNNKSEQNKELNADNMFKNGNERVFEKMESMSNRLDRLKPMVKDNVKETDIKNQININNLRASFKI